ncbi:MAG: hypothetical protein EAZ55_07585 [Cytophagales bacterium]|nr:MAG: hypothetical protein EAZ55_07585 [Cytophagales bacterium]
MHLKKYLIIFTCLLYLTACDANDDLKWQPEILAPLVKSDISFQSVPELAGLSYALTVPLGGLPITGASVVVPAFNNLNSTPAAFQINQAPVVEVGFSELTVEGTLQNPLGVPINAGGKIVIRNVADGSIVISHTIANTIAARGSYAFNSKVSKSKVKDQLEFLLQDISSPGSSGQAVSMSSNQFSFSLKLGLPTIDYADFRGNANSTTTQTTNFEMGLEDEGKATGNLVIQFQNAIALNFSIVIDFLDEKDQVLARLNSVPITIQAGSSSAPKSSTTTINASSVITQLQKAKKIRFTIAYTNPSATAVRVLATDKLSFKMISDIKADL